MKPYDLSCSTIQSVHPAGEDIRKKNITLYVKETVPSKFFDCLSPKTSVQRNVYIIYRLFFAAIKMIIFDLDFFVCLFVCLLKAWIVGT